MKASSRIRQQAMSTLVRVRNVLLSPANEWRVIEQETTRDIDLFVRYLAPIAGAAAVAAIIGDAVAARTSTPLAAILRTLITAFLAFSATAVMSFAMALIVNALAPHFGGLRNFDQALKVVVYSYTPVPVAGLAAAVPFVASLAAFVGALYGLYVLYLGLIQLMKMPTDQTPTFIVLLGVCGIVANFVLLSVLGRIIGAGFVGARLG